MENTLQNLITALEAKGINYDLTGETTRVHWHNGEAVLGSTDYSTEIGIKIQDFIWVWFDVSFLSTGETYFFFKQRYNQNTGKTIKGMRTGWKCKDKIEKLTGIRM